MKVITDIPNSGSELRSGCVCNRQKNNHTSVRGWWDPIFACKSSCKGEANKVANQTCADSGGKKG
ncbi:MAG: hypothetical protein SPG13_09350 [Peptostreptococcus porci]|uniref:hypothetical protein n=1 Tax=Peptostreptococcus porci TaxID=2652282 RepID=UPI002A914253|nr:hypothetical protein [Peptostreptococcus porci]MDY5480653.1 hypothetical protein [Peptostreptococcus porci]